MLLRVHKTNKGCRRHWVKTKKKERREGGIGRKGEIAREEKSTVTNICVAMVSKGSCWDQCRTVETLGDNPCPLQLKARNYGWDDRWIWV